MSVNYDGVNIYATEEFVLGHIPTADDAVNLLIEAGMIDNDVTDQNGNIYTSNTDDVYIL